MADTARDVVVEDMTSLVQSMRDDDDDVDERGK